MAKKPELNTLSIQKRLTVFNEIANRAMLASRLGDQYAGDRNIYTALGYPTEITYEDYYSRYHRQDIARAVINRPVSHTWKGAVKITEVGVQEVTDLEKGWKKLNAALKLKSKFIRVDKLSSIGTYGVLLLGFDDVKNPETFTKPIPTNPKLLYVKPLGQGNAKISTSVTDTKNPRYGMPELYDVEFSNPGDASSSTPLKVHHSRVIHITQELLESEIEGTPVLQPIWNRLMDLEKLVGGSAEMFWRGARPGYQGKVAEGYTLTPAVEAALETQLDEFEHNMRRFLVNEGVDMEALAPQVSDPSKHVDVQIQMIASITGIPKRVLIGSERGELSSDQDIVGWYNIIQTRREEHAEMNIMRPFIDKMIELKILPPPKTGEYQVTWEDLFAASDKDQAEIGRVRATALREYSQNPTAEMIIPPKAFYSVMLGLDEDEVAMIEGMVDANLEEELASIREATLLPKEPAPDPDPGTTKEIAEKPINKNGGE